jgi:RNA polymerase sigma factor (sigma-70 family)
VETQSADIERILVEKAKKGDRASMRRIVDCYSRYLTAICSRYVPDQENLRDVLQDSFVKILSSISRFEYRGEGSLKAWMRQITVNETLKFLRKRKRTDTVEYKWDLPDEEQEEEPDVGSVPPEEIQKMIKALPDGYRTVLNLYAFEEKSHKEIAAALGITESTSASQLHRARAMMSRMIKDYKKRTERTQ